MSPAKPSRASPSPDGGRSSAPQPSPPREEFRNRLPGSQPGGCRGPFEAKRRPPQCRLRRSSARAFAGPAGSGATTAVWGVEPAESAAPGGPGGARERRGGEWRPGPAGMRSADPAWDRGCARGPRAGVSSSLVSVPGVRASLAAPPALLCPPPLFAAGLASFPARRFPRGEEEKEGGGEGPGRGGRSAGGERSERPSAPAPLALAAKAPRS